MIFLYQELYNIIMETLNPKNSEIIKHIEVYIKVSARGNGIPFCDNQSTNMWEFQATVVQHEWTA